MSALDWFILLFTLAGIILFGIVKSRTSKNLEGYFLSDRSLPWYLVLLSIMGTQASAVTYLTGPGQSYTDGMRFLQYYFGLPLAMIVVSYVFVPVFKNLGVITAYQFLEQRFDVKTRTITAALFLLSRSLSTAISIFAPSIILSSLMGWNIYLTNLVMGGVLLTYTLMGGAKAVAYTQTLQMIIAFAAMFIIGWIAVKYLPGNMGLAGAIDQAKELGKMNVITIGITEKGFDWKDKYNIFSGIIGGFFLALSYFGTDHSQVGRYLTSRNIKESQRGLLMNGLVKIPMQYGILLIGILIFTHYYHHSEPIYFNAAKVASVKDPAQKLKLEQIESQYSLALQEDNYETAASLKTNYRNELKNATGGGDVNDANFIFLRFVKDNLPIGLIGLLFAVIFLSAWGSIAAALNALAACTVVDIHKKYFKSENSVSDYKLSQRYTLFWGIFCVLASFFFTGLGNSLIEAVNILGSWFYGVILGIFLIAFWFKYIKGNAVFWAAVVSEILVITVYYLDVISFLWLNVIGCVLTILLGFLFQYSIETERYSNETIE